MSGHVIHMSVACRGYIYNMLGMSIRCLGYVYEMGMYVVHAMVLETLNTELPMVLAMVLELTIPKYTHDVIYITYDMRQTAARRSGQPLRPVSSG